METKKQVTIFSKKISLVEKYNFYEYLAVMLDSWVGMTSALESVQDKISNPYFNLKIGELITFIMSGDPFSKAMKKVPQIFTLSEISIIESWEQTGRLANSFERMSEDLKAISHLKNKIKSALNYPAIIFGFLFIAVIVVLVYVIPNIRPLFDDAGIQLPFATQALLSTSDFIIWNFLYLIFFGALVFVGMIGYKNTDTGRKNMDNFYLNLPLVGKVYRNYILADIAGNLSSLIWSGVSIIKTLTLTGVSTNNAVYQGLFKKVIAKVSTGEKIVESMEQLDPENKYFPRDFLQMLEVWEKSAKIQEVALKMNKQYNRELDYSLSILTKWIEPLAILIAWMFVVWFAFAIFGAILKVTTSIG